MNVLPFKALSEQPENVRKRVQKRIDKHGPPPPDYYAMFMRGYVNWLLTWGVWL